MVMILIDCFFFFFSKYDKNMHDLFFFEFGYLHAKKKHIFGITKFFEILIFFKFKRKTYIFNTESVSYSVSLLNIM